MKSSGKSKKAVKEKKISQQNRACREINRWKNIIVDDGYEARHNEIGLNIRKKERERQRERERERETERERDRERDRERERERERKQKEKRERYKQWVRMK